MKTSLVIQECSASLVISAENEFELDALKQVELFKDRTVGVTTDQIYGKTTKGEVVITFNTNIKS